MAITLSNLGNKKKFKKRVGRGNASGHGTYSSRGLKGQRARSGGKGGLKLKGFKQNLLNLPKFKGMKSKKPKNQIVKISDLVRLFNDGDKINPGTLYEAKLIEKIDMPVKILLDKTDIELNKKYEIINVLLSSKVRSILEKNGSKVVEMNGISEKV